jgi:ligand-binding sensor domain-containing protein
VEGQLAVRGLSGLFRFDRNPVGHAHQLEQFDAERKDAVQRAVQGGLVEVGDQGVFVPFGSIRKSPKASRPISPRLPKTVIR